MPLSQSIDVGTLTLPNRLIMPAMRMDLANPDGTVTPALLDWYDRLTANIGMSLCVVEHTYVLPEGKVSPHQLGLFSPHHVPGHSEFTHILHRNDTLAVLQLGYGGTFIPFEIQKQQSAYARWTRNLDLVNHLSLPYMEEIATAFIQAAVLANHAGYDGVEIHAAHHFLLSCLYSPLTNRRSDCYGGSLRNRTSFLRQIVAGIRKALDVDFLIFVRFPVRDNEPGGATVEDAIETLRSLEMHGMDAADLSTGVHMTHTLEALSPTDFYADVTAIRNALHIPVIYSGGIATQSQADQVIDDGIADMVGVGRHIQNFER